MCLWIICPATANQVCGDCRLVLHNYFEVVRIQSCTYTYVKSKFIKQKINIFYSMWQTYLSELRFSGKHSTILQLVHKTCSFVYHYWWLGIILYSRMNKINWDWTKLHKLWKTATGYGLWPFQMGWMQRPCAIAPFSVWIKNNQQQLLSGHY